MFSVAVARDDCEPGEFHCEVCSETVIQWRRFGLLPAGAQSTGIGAGCSQVGDVEARLTRLKREREELLAQGKMSTGRLP
jgi:hypothetical protein